MLHEDPCNILSRSTAGEKRKKERKYPNLPSREFKENSNREGDGKRKSFQRNIWSKTGNSRGVQWGANQKTLHATAWGWYGYFLKPHIIIQVHSLKTVFGCYKLPVICCFEVIKLQNVCIDYQTILVQCWIDDQVFVLCWRKNCASFYMHL